MQLPLATFWPSTIRVVEGFLFALGFILKVLITSFRPAGFPVEFSCCARQKAFFVQRQTNSEGRKLSGKEDPFRAAAEEQPPPKLFLREPGNELACCVTEEPSPSLPRRRGTAAPPSRSPRAEASLWGRPAAARRSPGSSGAMAVGSRPRHHCSRAARVP